MTRWPLWQSEPTVREIGDLPMHDFRLGRLVVRVFYRPLPYWRPFFSRRYMLANFGGPFFGVMVMRSPA